MIIRSLNLVDWITLARHKATGLQEHIVGPEPWEFGLALRKAMLGQLFPAGEHWHSWIAIKEHRLMGLISARPRYSQQVWQVAHLLLNEESKDLATALFQQVTVAASQSGIERLFMRLPLDSPLRQLVLESGFEPYMVERLYSWSGLHQNLGQASQGIPKMWRSKTKHDNWAIFQLYCVVAPAVVQQVEGLVYADWLQSRERIKSYQEKVWEQEGQIRGWARARPWWDGILLEFLFYPGEEPSFTPLIERFIQYKKPIYCLVHSYQTQIQRLVEAEGFHPVEEHSLFIKQLLVKVRRTSPMPMRA